MPVRRTNREMKKAFHEQIGEKYAGAALTSRAKNPHKTIKCAEKEDFLATHMLQETNELAKATVACQQARKPWDTAVVSPHPRSAAA